MQHKSTASKNGHSASHEIQQDLDVMKSGAASLAQHIQKNGQTQVESLKRSALHQIDVLQQKSRDGIEAIDGQIKANPRRSVLFAFIAGIVLNALMKRGAA